MPIFTALHGEVQYRGTYLPRPSAEQLLAIFRKDAKQPDYFQSDAKRLADELSAAMAEAYQPQEQAA
jgi:hypothetical protein